MAQLTQTLWCQLVFAIVKISDMRFLCELRN